MLSKLRRRRKSIEASTNKFNHPIYSAYEADETDDMYNETDEYIEELSYELDNQLREYDIDVFRSKSGITLNVSFYDYDGDYTTTVLDIPYSRLSMNFGKIDHDVDYIADTIEAEIY